LRPGRSATTFHRHPTLKMLAPVLPGADRRLAHGRRLRSARGQGLRLLRDGLPRRRSRCSTCGGGTLPRSIAKTGRPPPRPSPPIVELEPRPARRTTRTVQSKMTRKRRSPARHLHDVVGPPHTHHAPGNPRMRIFKIRADAPVVPQGPPTSPSSRRRNGFERLARPARQRRRDVPGQHPVPRARRAGASVGYGLALRVRDRRAVAQRPHLRPALHSHRRLGSPPGRCGPSPTANAWMTGFGSRPAASRTVAASITSPSGKCNPAPVRSAPPASRSARARPRFSKSFIRRKPASSGSISGSNARGAASISSSRARRLGGPAVLPAHPFDVVGQLADQLDADQPRPPMTTKVMSACRRAASGSTSARSKTSDDLVAQEHGVGHRS